MTDFTQSAINLVEPFADELDEYFDICDWAEAMLESRCGIDPDDVDIEWEKLEAHFEPELSIPDLWAPAFKHYLYEPVPPTAFTPPQENNTMTIENVTLINGARADLMSDDNILAHVRKLKDEIKNLDDVKESKAVQKRIEEAQDQIKQLIALVDARVEKDGE